MNTTLYFYSHLDCEELQVIVEKHQAWLDDELHRLYDLVDDDEQGVESLKKIDQWSEELGAPEVHPIHEELCFDDLTFDESSSDLMAQKQFFAGCRSSLVWQHLADFHTNPLQVTAVKHFCEIHPEILIDGDIDDRLYFGQEFKAKLSTQFQDSQKVVAPEQKSTLKKKMKIVLDDNPIELRLKKIRLYLENQTPVERDQLRESFIKRWPELELLYRGIEADKDQEELRVYCELLPKAYTDGVEKIFLFLKK